MMFSHIVWSLRMLKKYSIGALLILSALIPVRVGMRYFEIYLPARIVACVTEERALGHTMFVVGALVLAIMLCAVCKTAMEEFGKIKLMIYRYKMEELVVKKDMHMFYQTYEKKEIRDLGSRAREATQMWNGREPVTDLLKSSFELIENLSGYLLFGSVLFSVNPFLIPLLTAAPIIHLLSVQAYQKWKYAQRKKITDLNKKLNFVTNLPSQFSVAKDIRIYGMTSWLKDCFRELSKEKEGWDKRIAAFGLLPKLVDLILILIRDGGAYALLILMVMQGKISVDQFVLYFAAVSSFADWIGGVIQSFQTMHACSLQVGEFREYVEYKEPEEGNRTVKKDDFVKPEIVFDNVCFRYDNAKKDAIHNVSFTLHGGEKLALVGVNGAGKTTLVKLLCGLYLPTSGEIRINGIPIGDISRREYYKLIAPVFQDIRTGFFSLAEIVSGADPTKIDKRRVEDCIRQAGLGNKLDALPEGVATRLNKQVNQNGIELSGGEAQKLMLARALYKDAPLLVLDEPTAALDPIAEGRIYVEYNRMTENKTSLFISHRLASTSFCDRIILLKNGEICEEGTHKELLRKNGEYSTLFELQSCWYQEEGGAFV